MPTSGTTTWNYTRDQIINAAWRKIDVLNQGETPTSLQQVAAQEALNNIVYTLYAQGMPLWAMTQMPITLIAGQATYNLGIGQTINVPAPLKVVQAWSHDDNQDQDIPMNIYTAYNFNQLTSKMSQGLPIQIWYEPLNQTGIIHLWPVPNTYSATNRTVYIRYQRPFEEFDASTDTPDFPQVWIEPLIYSLAHRLAPEYGVDPSDTSVLQQTANEMIENALSFGTEEGSMYLTPDWVTYDMGHNGY